MTFFLEGGASGDGDTARSPSEFLDSWAKAVDAQIAFSEELQETKPSSDFNFYAIDRLPSHVTELYDKFTQFVALFYKWLELQQGIGGVALLKDIDECPNEMLKIFKNIYATGLPNKTFKQDEQGESVNVVNFDDPANSSVNVRNFLRYVKNFYQLKSTEEAYDFFFKTFYATDVKIDYPKKLLHVCSEGSFLGASAGYTGPAGATYEACSEFNAAGKPAAPGSVCGVYYGNEQGLISGFSRIHDNKYYQNYSYLIDTDINWDSYKDYVKEVLHPAGMFIAGNYVLTDIFDQPGTTGTTVPIEIPVIGNYTPYRFSTSTNLRDNASGADLYPCGYNPYVAASGISYTSQHFQDTGGLWYKNEAGTTAHQVGGFGALNKGFSMGFPLGICGADHPWAGIGGTGFTGGEEAAQIGINGFRIFHHPNSWSVTVQSATEMKNISLGAFLFLSAINTNVGSPNNATESTAGCGSIGG